jgi:outer membrane biosynthesis protein TonB
MAQSVSDVIAARAQGVDRLGATLTWSIAAHVVLVAAVAVMPANWRGQAAETSQTVMNISLGGAPGPSSGGMTPIAGRVVQAPEPEEPPQRADRPPAQIEPEMGLPTERRERVEVERTNEEARGSTPTTGPEPQEGPAAVDTGARGQGFGLTTGGGGGTGAFVDVSNFCCPEYLDLMVQLIQRNWDSNQRIAARTQMVVTIQRDGRISFSQVERPSGYLALDMAATRAVALTQLPPLPAQYPGSDLTVHFVFEYQR